MKKIITDNYFYGNTGNPAATHQLISLLPKMELVESHVGENSETAAVDHETRKCGTAVIEEEGPLMWGLEKAVRGANKLNWNKELYGRFHEDFIHYLVYNEPDDKFIWHADAYEGDEVWDFRKLSISYCLSSINDYEGAEFCIGDEELKMDFGDFIVFPSDIKHCVKPLVSGRREVLVGWYY